MNIEQIAKVTHDINKAYCEALGDMSQKGWDFAPEWQKESAARGVEFHIANPSAPPSASHDSWMKQKLDDGWVYGQEKNEVLKTHPCIVPYEQLPIEQQAKDYLFRQTVHSLKNFTDTGYEFELLKEVMRDSDCDAVDGSESILKASKTYAKALAEGLSN